MYRFSFPVISWETFVIVSENLTGDDESSQTSD
jgi:hypothetical protein